jgi:CheY-like chemotaxis protein
MPAHAHRTVAVFNASADTIEMLKMMLSERGHHAVSGAVDDVKSGAFDFITFLHEHQPDGLIWDISPPYDRNWTFFKIVRNLAPLQGRPIVVTTTNKQRLNELVGHDTGAIEIVAKPYDIELIVSAVERMMEHTASPLRAVRTPPGAEPLREEP